MATCIGPTIGQTIHSFTESFDGLADLRVARVVDETVDALLAEAKFYRGHAVLGRSIIARIVEQTPSPGEFMDEAGDLEAGLREVIDRAESMLSLWTASKGKIDGDKRLSSGHCDMLHSSYDDALVALATLIETSKDMLAAVISHDLKAEPRSDKTFSSVRELHASILHG
ncbi:MAG: hypothetical protein IPF83_00950 [Rhodanobacteraceae bacterium]|nr:hypothetical protein [Rhodanobacteraceae bacterium]HQW81258.1 hypothetical protein [Pseudomonadota bacterium]